MLNIIYNIIPYLYSVVMLQAQKNTWDATESVTWLFYVLHEYRTVLYSRLVPYSTCTSYLLRNKKEGREQANLNRKQTNSHTHTHTHTASTCKRGTTTRQNRSDIRSDQNSTAQHSTYRKRRFEYYCTIQKNIIIECSTVPLHIALFCRALTTTT